MSWIVLGAAFSMQMVFSGIHFAFGHSFKPIAEDFGWSQGATGFAARLACLKEPGAPLKEEALSAEVAAEAEV